MLSHMVSRRLTLISAYMARLGHAVIAHHISRIVIQTNIVLLLRGICTVSRLVGVRLNCIAFWG
jgi:hypothetical protein